MNAVAAPDFLDWIAEDATEDGLLMGEDGGRGLARSERSWSEVSMDSSWVFLPRVEVREDEAIDDGVPGLEAFRVDRREVSDLGEDILNGVIQ
jgi:hypothetical protein